MRLTEETGTDHRPSDDAWIGNLIRHWREDPGASYRTWFLWEERIKNFRSIRRGLQAVVEEIADSEEVRQALKSQMRMAADLGLYATPSYVLGHSGILGHPGANAMAKMIASTRRCDRLAC